MDTTPVSLLILALCGSVINNDSAKWKKIKGMNINNKDVLLSQFADDTTLCLDGIEQSLY